MTTNKKKLNPNAQKWVDALRNGNYKQGKSWLASGSSYCCLGVACDLFVKSGGNIRVQINGATASFDGEDARLPERVRAWLGLRSPWGRYGTDPENTGPALYEHNDDEGKTFAEIADLIESQPEGLFK